MVGGLVAGYGTFAGIIGRFLFPSSDTRRWQFVTDLQSIKPGQSLTFVSPSGERVVITRIAEVGTADDFIALSSVCPHLGCQVHWEPQNNRFFCPCHNGAFDPEGNPTEGPPKDANQHLPRYPLRIVQRHEGEAGLLYIHVETERLVAENGRGGCSGNCGDCHSSDVQPVALATTINQEPIVRPNIG